MKLLATTKIAAIPVKIYMVPQIVSDAGVELHGLAVYGADCVEIKIQEGLGPEIFGETLMHELVHAVELTFDMNLRETTVTTLGSGLFQILSGLDWEPGRKKK